MQLSTEIPAAVSRVLLGPLSIHGRLGFQGARRTAFLACRAVFPKLQTRVGEENLPLASFGQWCVATKRSSFVLDQTGTLNSFAEAPTL
eukprot:6195933-Pleurochrysis_carterae.AAC.2